MVIVLCYHKISNNKNDFNMINVTPENFRMQMQYLNKQYRFIALKDIYKEALKHNECSFAVTFDDGYKDVFHEAFPILEEFKIPTTVFVTTENLGTSYENWTDNIIRAIFEPASKKDYFLCMDDELRGKWYTRDIEEKVSFYRKINFFFRHIDAKTRKKYENVLLEWAGLSREGRYDRRILSIQELKQMSENPLISIGTHCVTHPSLGALTDKEQEFEISNSIQVLNNITGQPVKYMAYPFGSRSSYSAVTVDLLKQYGIEMAFTTLGEKITLQTDPYQIPRIVMGNYDSNDFQNTINCIIEEQSVDQMANWREKTLAVGAVDYFGRIENDLSLFYETKDIIVWGYGFWGKSLYDDLKLLNLKERVIAFGDNDPDKVGMTNDGIPILSKTDILKMPTVDNLVVLVRNSNDVEIYKDLKTDGFERVHLISR